VQRRAAKSAAASKSSAISTHVLLILTRRISGATLGFPSLLNSITQRSSGVGCCSP